MQEKFWEAQELYDKLFIDSLENLKSQKETKKVDDNGLREILAYLKTNMDVDLSIEAYYTKPSAYRKSSIFLYESFNKEMEERCELVEDFEMFWYVWMANGGISEIEDIVIPNGFFTPTSKEIFVVCKSLPDKPQRYSKKEWENIWKSSILLHEILHRCQDFLTGNLEEDFQEEFAYMGMIGWCRDKGLTDEEIVNHFLIQYGISYCNYHGESEREFQDKAKKESYALIKRFDNKENIESNINEEILEFKRCLKLEL